MEQYCKPGPGPQYHKKMRITKAKALKKMIEENSQHLSNKVELNERRHHKKPEYRAYLEITGDSGIVSSPMIRICNKCCKEFRTTEGYAAAKKKDEKFVAVLVID